MSEEYFTGRKQVEVRAIFIGHRLNMKALEQARRLTASPFVMRAGTDGLAVLFRYGVIVMFGMGGIEQASFLSEVEDFVIHPFNEPSFEDGLVLLDPEEPETVQPEYIRLQTLDLDRVQLIAEVLAKAAVLEYYEKRVAVHFDHIELIAADMQNGWPKARRTRDLLRHIGLTLSIQRKMIGHVEVAGKPELLWEMPVHEKLYVRMEDEYEIPERHTALKDKLELIHRTAETMLSIVQERRTLHVEWYIVILIVFELCLSLGETLFNHLAK